MNRFVGLFVAAILLAAPFSAVASKTYSDKDGQIIEFSSYFGVDLWGTQVKPINAHGILYLPKDASSENKVPQAVLVPGLGGQRGRDNRMCETLSQRGIACFGVRTYSSRDIPHEQKHSQKFKIAGAGSRMHDAYGALAYFSKRKEIDAGNIWFIGFSLGGFLASLSVDDSFTNQFNEIESDFAGFINLYGGCPTTVNPNFKVTTYRHFIGSGDVNYDEEGCSEFINSLKIGGVDTDFVFFKGSQFNKVGHAWDSMKAATSKGGWFGQPEGPWKHNRSNHKWGDNGLSIYGCGFKINVRNEAILANGKSIESPTDNEGWDFILENCGRRKGVSKKNHKITNQVDDIITNTIKAK